MKKLFVLPLVLGLFCFPTGLVLAQDQATQAAQATQQPSDEELEKQKAEKERNAYRLLDQVLDEAQTLRLTENRARIQINAADMLWDQNQARSRSLFSMAADGVAEMGRSQASSNSRRTFSAIQNENGFVTPAGPGPQNFRSFQLRQELVLTAARHDAALAYQLLAATKPPTPANTAADQRGPRAQLTSEDTLEQTLLGRIAALDPKLAAQNAEQMMEKGQFPRTLPEVINQLRGQDPDAADKLADKTVKRLQATNILTNSEAGVLVQSLLTAGPKPPSSEGGDAGVKQPVQSRAPATLDQSAYMDLLSTVIDAALKATPATQNNQRAQANPRARTPGARPNAAPTPPTDAQIEQNNARRLLTGLQSIMPVIDQYLPAKAPAVRQKMMEMGLTASSPLSAAQTFSALQGNPTADALIQAAGVAPAQMQSRLYQQAAFKALDEGDTERARQIATDHLQNNARDTVIQRIDFRELTKKAEGGRFEEIRQAAARFQTEDQKIDFLIQVGVDAEKTNHKLAVQLLEEAKQMTSRRATGYEQFEQQLKVAHAFAAIDPQRSFEVLDPGISQLNELLTAASVLSGFEINMFRDGEMAIQGGNGLTSTVNRYGQELAVLARNDFERSETLAGRFQFPEPRIMARLAIVQGLLGVRPTAGAYLGFPLTINGVPARANQRPD